MIGKAKTHKSAFSLLETLAAVAIIAVLLAVMVPQVANFVATAQRESDKRTLTVLNDALTRYKTGGGDLTALTIGIPISNVLNRLQQPINWNGMVHQVMKQGETYPARSVMATGSGRTFRFWRFNSMTETGGNGPGSSPVAKFITGGSGGIYYSTNYTTWTSASIPAGFAGSQIRGLCYGSGKFAGISNGSGGAGTATVILSNDAINWISIPITTSGATIDIFYLNGMFFVTTWSSTLQKSSDGATWSSQTISNNNWNSMSYGSGKYIILGSAGTIASSSDTNTWSYTPIGITTTGQWISCTYGKGKFVAISYDDNRAAYSTDGTTWTAATLPASQQWYYVTFGNGRFVAVGRGATNIGAYSDDGITWNQTTLPASSNWSHIYYANGKYYATAALSGIGASSADGVNWVSETIHGGAIAGKYGE